MEPKLEKNLREVVTFRLNLIVDSKSEIDGDGGLGLAWSIMPTGESILEVFIPKNPPTLVVRSVSSL